MSTHSAPVVGGPHDGHVYETDQRPPDREVFRVKFSVGGELLIAHAYRYDAERNVWRHVYAMSPEEYHAAFGDDEKRQDRQRSNERREERTGQDRKA